MPATEARAQAEAQKIVTREGNDYTDRPTDHGGPTKYGIMLATLSTWRGTSCAAADVENLTEAEAVSIYLDIYMQWPGFTGIQNDGIFDLTVDSGVQHGAGEASLWLQRAAGVKVDGHVGPQTLAAVNGGDQQGIYNALVKERQAYYAAIIARDPSQQQYAAGWRNRMAQFVGRTV